jgi:AraC family transcriptional regulator of adaptative response/methylated-DNA-[protein]-cysteine methyltransferase
MEAHSMAIAYETTASNWRTQPAPQDDYARVKAAIGYLTLNHRAQPGLDEVASHVGLSPAHFQRLFKRWAGLSPKAFLQAVTLDHAKRLLQDSASVLDAAYEVGLSGPGRLHDLFVTHVALSPGEYKSKGDGLTVHWGFHPSPFGLALAVVTERGLAGLGFADHEQDRQVVLADMIGRWPHARYIEDPERTGPFVRRIFDRGAWRSDMPLRILLIGSDFEVRVWEALLRIPFGRATTYSDVARRIGRPSASRAVGAAVGRNPISFVVPCHRVLGRAGGLCGYHWGLTRKRAMLGWEAGVMQEGRA